MRILQLCKKFPFPLKDGESIAVHHLAAGLADKGHDIDLLTFNTSKHYVDISQLPKSYNHYGDIYATPLDNKLSPWGALKALLTNTSYHISRFEQEDFRKKLIEILQEKAYDVIQVETIFMMPYIDDIRAYSDALICLRSHNVEHEIWQRIGEQTRFLPKKWYLEVLTRQLKAYELNEINKSDVLLTVTKRDLLTYQNHGFDGVGDVLPIGLNLREYPFCSPVMRPFSICFIGSLDWMPNLIGLEWFIKKVWPLILQMDSSITLHIAGRNIPDDLMELQEERIKVHGEVADAKTFIQSHSCMIVPLNSGSGMRVKILESMALGTPVVSTTIGIEGIDAENGASAFILDEPEEMAKALIAIKENENLGQNLAEKGRRLIEQRYDIDQNIQFIERLFQSMINQKK